MTGMSHALNRGATLKNKVRLENGKKLSEFATNTGWAKSHAPTRKLHISSKGLNRRADFSSNDTGIFKLYIHKDIPTQSLF